MGRKCFLPETVILGATASEYSLGDSCQMHPADPQSETVPKTTLPDARIARATAYGMELPTAMVDHLVPSGS
eukprot:9150508-Alexandrium_andersonii.AAC.1